MSLAHAARLVAGAVLGLVSLSALSAVSPRQTVGSYTLVAALPRIVDGQLLRDFAFDSVPRRLFACSDRGLFWSELGDPKPTVKGPLFEKDILRIELAPEAGRLFYFTAEEVGYVDVRNAPKEPVTVAAGRFWATDITYEPTRQEVYVATRSSRMLVFDAVSGEQADDILVPGWYATGLEAIPGRVFMNVANKSGVYQIDAATHVVTPWPIDGQVVTPARFEADPAGHTLFAAYDQFIVAVDTRTAKEVGRIVTSRDSTMAFDPGTGWLVASWGQWQRSSLHLRAFQVGPTGFTEVGVMEDDVQGGIAVGLKVAVPGLEPTSRGFIQLGGQLILVWQSSEGVE